MPCSCTDDTSQICVYQKRVCLNVRHKGGFSSAITQYSSRQIYVPALSLSFTLRLPSVIYSGIRRKPLHSHWNVFIKQERAARLIHNNYVSSVPSNSDQHKQTDVTLEADWPRHSYSGWTSLLWKPCSKTPLWDHAAVTSMSWNLGESRSNQWSYNPCGTLFSHLV